VECAASLGGLGCTSAWRARSDCGSGDIAGGSTGAAGDGFTDGFLVASARAAAAGLAWEAAGVLAGAVRIFIGRAAMAVGVRGGDSRAYGGEAAYGNVGTVGRAPLRPYSIRTVPLDT